MPTSGIFTNYGEEVFLKHFFTSQSYSKPSNYFIALFTAVTDKEAGTVTEVSGGGYARQAISSSTGFTWDGTNRRIQNASAITFPTATANWGTITAIGIYDASTGGNLLAVINLEQSKTVNSGDSLTIPAGELRIELD